ncbi:hypothetical protein GIB67_000609 [Kingdonia uniflora]|uniref:protein-tyrosine-phosphatase n=1 Tax=Kingdonia uniflora TaxID=39325 RepID=A0A7J7P7W4_9MAGN|nr:hypothetical protein GIB67_000609 [Kingdonia uniflora]
MVSRGVKLSLVIQFVLEGELRRDPDIPLEEEEAQSEPLIISAAIITAYLMRTEQLSQEGALESLRLSCESVCPNDGFLDQLKMFEDMGFKVDPASSIYKRFRLRILGGFRTLL